MPTTSLIRPGGLAGIFGGVLYALAALLHPVGEDLAAATSSTWVPAHSVFWVSSTLILLGLVGIHARQAKETGWLGLASFVLSFIAVALVGGLMMMVSTAVPLIVTEAPALFEQAMTPPVLVLTAVLVGYGLGFIVFGVVTMRARVLPRWSGLLLIMGVVLSLAEGSPIDQTVLHVVVTVGRVMFGLAIAWMGYALWSEKREVATSSGDKQSSVTAHPAG